MKLPEILLLSAAAGFFTIWIAEFQRTTFAESYWLVMMCLAFLLAFQYVRNKRLEREKAVSPTIKQMVTDRTKSAESTKKANRKK
jgi:Flp pilus assembly protein TadB